MEPTTYLCSYKTSSVLFDMRIKGQDEFFGTLVWNGFHVFHHSIQSTASRYYIERRLIPNKYTTGLQHLIKPHLTRPSWFYLISWSLWVWIVPWVSKFFLSEHAMIVVLCCVVVFFWGFFFFLGWCHIGADHSTKRFSMTKGDPTKGSFGFNI